MNLEAARLLIRENIWEAVLLIEAEGLPIPVELKRRDRREPKRREKERQEDRLTEVVLRHWRKQRRHVRAYLEEHYPERKQFWDPLGDPDPEDIADMAMVFAASSTSGIAIVEDIIGGRIDLTTAKGKAAAWAAEHSSGLFKQLDETTLKAVRSAIEAFSSTPGMSIRDVMDLLPFDEQRAMRVAVTEITAAYAQGQKLAGDEMKDQMPEIAVFKRWYTNNDDRVCEICGPLENMEVPFEDQFTPEGDNIGLEQPPAHINCRCWMDVYSDILRAE